jgi:hypothetical protein
MEDNKCVVGGCNNLPVVHYCYTHYQDLIRENGELKSKLATQEGSQNAQQPFYASGQAKLMGFKSEYMQIKAMVKAFGNRYMPYTSWLEMELRKARASTARVQKIEKENA